MAKIVVVGLGYVGLTVACGMSTLGHSVLGLDIDSERILNLNRGLFPISEAGLEKAWRNVQETNAVSFHSDPESILETPDFYYLCVPTPSDSVGKTDLSFLHGSLMAIDSMLSPGSTVVIKSTVPIGTGAQIAEQLKSRKVNVASSPEFLSEGTAFEDFMNPSRIVIGADSPEVANLVLELYQGITSPKIICGISSAETIKHASNSMLALKLSFVNELAALCEATGARTDDVIYGVGTDPRIGKMFMSPGPGWGGSCFPKDTAELTYRAKELGAPMQTVEAAIASNRKSISRVGHSISEQLEGDLTGKKIAVWGLAFKAKTDDTRDSPALAVIDFLLKQGAIVAGYDPVATVAPGQNFTQSSSAIDACKGADALVVLTEWEEFAKISPSAVSSIAKPNLAIYDGRRILKDPSWRTTFSKFRVLGDQ